MLDTAWFLLAEDKLQGIRATISKTKHCTEGQKEAIKNIARSKGWPLDMP